MIDLTEKQKALIDELVKDGMTAEQVFGEHGLLKTLQKRAMESVLEGEMSAHLGYEPHALKAATAATHATARPKRRSRLPPTASRSTSRATATAASSPS